MCYNFFSLEPDETRHISTGILTNRIHKLQNRMNLNTKVIDQIRWYKLNLMSLLSFYYKIRNIIMAVMCCKDQDHSPQGYRWAKVEMISL